MSQGKVILVTGASSGIGAATVRELLAHGHIVYAAARRVGNMADLRDAGARTITLDVTDEAACKQAVEQVISEQGHIDVLFNNAGYGSYGPLENVELDEARRQFEVNVFGAMALVRAVLPHMRAQGCGTIITTSSMGGRLVSHFGGWYHATKYAVEALSDALRMETAPFGVNVVLVEPGGIKTPWGHIAADHLAESARGGAYGEAAAKTAASMHAQYSSAMLSDPRVIARTVERIVRARRPRPRYLVGFMAKPLVFLHAVLPTRAFDWLMTHMG